MSEKKRVAWDFFDRSEIEAFSRDYMDFLKSAKTEREVVDFLVDVATRNGFVELNKVNGKLSAGDKVFMVFRGKTAVFAVVGRKSIREGLRIVAAHGDAPRLDPKPRPILEDSDAQLATLNVGFYGGVVTYQWVGIPLEIRGVVATKTGVKRVRLGPLTAPDLLPHLSKKRFTERKASDTVKGEEIKILLVNIPVKKGEELSWKDAVLQYLKEKLGIEEDDLVSADLEVVPAIEPFETGLDGSMIAAYGQDDRVCVYTGFRALLDAKDPMYTSVFWVVDKEEIGSETNTSAQSEFFRYFVSKLLELTEGYSELALREALLRSKAISADVGALINPGFKGDQYDVDNMAKMGRGVLLEKYLSAAGKGGANEAHAEYVAWLRRILDENGIPWQPALLVSKADKSLGGGGTISKFMARLGMDVVDIGVGLLGMHSPLEVSAKVDVYSAYKAFKVFFEAED